MLESSEPKSIRNWRKGLALQFIQKRLNGDVILPLLKGERKPKDPVVETEVWGDYPGSAVIQRIAKYAKDNPSRMAALAAGTFFTAVAIEEGVRFARKKYIQGREQKTDSSETSTEQQPTENP